MYQCRNQNDVDLRRSANTFIATHNSGLMDR